jgi:hypothetical protein
MVACGRNWDVTREIVYEHIAVTTAAATAQELLPASTAAAHLAVLRGRREGLPTQRVLLLLLQLLLFFLLLWLCS